MGPGHRHCVATSIQPLNHGESTGLFRCHPFLREIRLTIIYGLIFSIVRVAFGGSALRFPLLNRRVYPFKSEVIFKMKGLNCPFSGKELLH